MNADLREAIALLKKYQARYHGVPYAKKDWEKTDAFIKRVETKALTTREVEQEVLDVIDTDHQWCCRCGKVSSPGIVYCPDCQP